LHNVTLDQYTITVGKTEFVHGVGFMALHCSSSKNDVQSPLHFFLPLPTINCGELLKTYNPS